MPRRWRFAAAALTLVALAVLVEHRVVHPRDAVASCASCHQGVTGLDPSHLPLGCEQCHLGNARATQASEAHQGLVKIPGNVADVARTCGTATCHAAMPVRLQNNIMTTMNGVVSVDRFVFHEQPTATAVTPVDSLGTSPADLHLRNLCASCHLSNPKTDYGPIDETSRGGGCNACHLLAASKTGRDGGSGFVHARLRALPAPVACVGCHARSGRISLNYEGWAEAAEPCEREFHDGRCLQHTVADVHAQGGLVCVDCHGSWELMGTGAQALHEEAQSMLGCDDCHQLRAAKTVERFEELDQESARVIELEGLSREGPYVTMRRSGLPLVNVTLRDGGLVLQEKHTKALMGVKPPAPACARTEHRRLSCSTCHSAWAPRCNECHTRFVADSGMYDLLDNTERAGEWLETGGAMLADLPTLGVRGDQVVPFVPGMVMTLELPDGGRSFQRRFAASAPHTTQRSVRSCTSCHADPVALGYGRGQLRLLRGRWAFEPADGGRATDGLPHDAWVGFLQTVDGANSTTRENTRPLTADEQARVLTVGRCLTCHLAESSVMNAALDDFTATLSKRRPACRR